jgi:ring-1,2-phenylacetyl-CoA epoxidase subunit PaaE
MVMGLLGNIFKKKEQLNKSRKGFIWATVRSIQNETSDAVSISFDIPLEYLPDFHFVAGQYINLIVPVKNGELRRSYSICSAPVEILTIGVKDVKKEGASSFLNTQLKVGDKLEISYPLGNFQLSKKNGNMVAFAAGSGITPILSIAREINKNNGQLRLFYGNRNKEAIMFKSVLDNMGAHIQTHYFVDNTPENTYFQGPLNKETIAQIIKNDLSLLKADGFYICGPEPMIIATVETLKLFGVEENKIVYELFTTPVNLKSKNTQTSISFEGIAKIEVLLDGEKVNFELSSNGMTILDKLTELGEDAPYSCKGGVCCTCKAKVSEGKASMDMNYSLTDKEVEEGYILTCQAHPASAVVKLSYDD